MTGCLWKTALLLYAIDLTDAVNPVFLEYKNVQKSFWIDKKKYSTQQVLLNVDVSAALLFVISIFFNIF